MQSDSGKEGLVGYVERHLLPDERVLYKTRLHWILLLKPALLLAASLIAIGWSWRMEAPRAVLYLEATVAGVGFLWGLVRYIEMMTSEFAVTSVRLILKVGLIARYTTELLISKVESIGVAQSLVGRMIDFGDLTVTGTGGAREVFKRVKDPISFRNHVQMASIPADRGRSERGLTSRAD
jgi:uncharacterized membrane protein YdbT with pleckstrin-like domain